MPIFIKTYGLYKTFYEFLPTFPKKARYTFGQRCEVVLLELMEAIVVASSLPKSEKLPILKKASVRLDLVKVFFRLGKDLRVIENRQYSILDSQTQEIGKMLGGWIRVSSE